MSQLNSLFQPFAYGPLQLNNRIVMPPMTRNFSPGNIPNEQVVDYYRRRAAGGVGLIITEGTCINHQAANGYANIPFIYGDEALAGWKKVVDAVHEEGGKIVPQLWHVGSVRKAGTEPHPEVPGYGPSGTLKNGKQVCHEMSKSDIADVIAAFAQGAKDAQAIGFDGVEIHGAHGYLIDQFFWQRSNLRDDEYGGSLANRSRFAIEIIEAIRAEVGPDFPIIFRWSQWKQQDYTARLAETAQALEEFLLPLSEAGVDIFHCSTRRFWDPEFPGSELNLAGWTKKITGKPSITVGSVSLDKDFLPSKDGIDTSFKEAEPASLDTLLVRIDRQEFDLVAVGRALIANPHWPKVVQEQGIEGLKAYEKEMLSTLA